ncbi:MAG: hypothetical protein RIC35_02565 [Marinoscillum sp.]
MDDTRIEGDEHYNQCHAIAEDVALRRFMLIKRTGLTLSVPYSLLPLYQLDANKLAIVSHELKVLITGRNLKALLEYLSDECLVWVRERDHDDGEAFIYISEINIESENLNSL